MSRKDLRRTDWHRVTRRKEICRPTEWNGHTGLAGLMLIEEVTAPLTISYPYGPVTIADKGYSWLQIALRDARFWITAMFDDRNRLIQIYCDITAGNQFDDPENPWFEDMYLDICTAPDGSLCVLDEDELEEALQTGNISSAAYDQARRDCRALHEYLEVNLLNVTEHCKALQKAMKRELCLV